MENTGLPTILRQSDLALKLSQKNTIMLVLMSKKRIEDAEIEYEGEGMFVAGSWKQYSDKIYKPQDAVISWKNILRSGLISEEQKRLLFISASSHIPTHEKAIFQSDQLDNPGRMTMVAGDIRNIDKQDVYPEGLPNQFKMVRWDATHLPIDENLADVVWDRKGVLFHKARDEGGMGVLDLLDEYRRVLRPRGLVIIDNNNYIPDINSRTKMHLRYIEYQIGINQKKYTPADFVANPQGQYEPSTCHIINTQCEPFIWEMIRSDYVIQDIGTKTHRTRVLIKR